MTARRFSIVMVAVSFLVSGCTVGPDYTQTTSSRISDHFRNDAVSFADGQFPQASNGQIPVEQWWQSFADPILSDLVSRAMHQSLTLQGAYERIVEARANFRLQTGQLLPDGTTQSSYEFLKRSPNARPFVGSNGDPFNLFTHGLSVAWELDLFGRIERTIEAAEASAELQGFDLEAIRQVLVADIASSYLRVRLLQQQISLTHESLSLQRQTVEMIDSRATAGASTDLDRAQTKSFLRRSEALLADLEQQLSVEFNQLSVLLGEAPGENIIHIVGVQPLPQIPMLPATGIPADLLRRRPDVRRDERAVAAASARIGIAEADLYPRLSLLGDISLSAMSPSTLFQTDSLAFSIGPSFSWNVLHFGRIFSNIEIFESQFRQAIITYEQTVLQAVREVEDGLAQHHGAFRQWNSFSAAIEEDKQAVELSLTRYEIGKINFQRVLDAQQQLLLDRQQQAAQQAAAIEQLIRTHKALGGGWNSEWSGSSNTCGTCADCGCDSGCSSCSSCSTCSTGPVASGESIVSQNVSQAATQIVNQGVTQLVPHGVTQLVPHGVTKLATQGATKLIPQGVAKLVPQGVAKLVPQGVAKLVPPSVTQVANQPVWEIVPENVPPIPATVHQQSVQPQRYANRYQLYPPVPEGVNSDSILR